MVFVARPAFDPALDAAELGAAAQARQLVHEGAPFPAIGMHWLRGLLLLRAGRVGQAIQLSHAKSTKSVKRRMYASEFRVNAQVAAGFAHLIVDDVAGAVDAFRLALASLPMHGRALIGLYQALQSTSLATEAERLWPKIDAAIEELTRGKRLGEAAVVRAGALAARGDVDGACLTVQRLSSRRPAKPGG